ncbi:MAG TPA: YajQ family cyclic di-GMP-binding protein [Nitriliruptorales bacterium]|nr:YajQ family cyclic di-GMP-binding protein [Nitriliruptorales bacterium]
MAEHSFDIEAGVDRQEVDNAVNQAAREVATRFDFKDTGTSVAWEGRETIRIQSDTEDRAKAALEVLRDKLVRRKVSLKAIDPGDPRSAAGATTRIDVGLRTEMPAELAKQIVKDIRATKLKVTPTNMGDRIRVASKQKDVLQEIIAMVKTHDHDAPLVFTNYK